jgi:hypothetical protein
MDLSNHFELMNHEICGTSVNIQHKGYRVDGDSGIKLAIGLNTRKSIDYFYIRNDRCLFIEFTDLARGQEDLIGLDSTVQQISNTHHRNLLAKLLRQNSKRDLVEKFKDSKDIFFEVPQHYTRYPNEFSQRDAKTFYIVHAPINDELSDVDKSSIARYLITLKSTVSQCLENSICDRVKLVLLDQFIQELG